MQVQDILNQKLKQLNKGKFFDVFTLVMDHIIAIGFMIYMMKTALGMDMMSEDKLMPLFGFMWLLLIKHLIIIVIQSKKSNYFLINVQNRCL